ncbi:hypothetical protein F0562_033069 [Nyssa sinensis]|uniref:F-box/LRR-repeat protein 15/At3g58940/PEG3-like LRR domain-containing protein n=1 Tax=Nyssa sinensis TaxID=561372 RepID=A0A5J5AR28_9ASTE|nr:hypothetical protein F0562_033069 [Nyssa sinensis]
MCLPIQDAVRTSVLSSKWRYNWVNLPQLIFDDNLCKMSGRYQWPTQEKLVMIISQVLLLHRGPIHKFTLSISELESCYEIDQFILFVSKNGVREFTLQISKGVVHKLPSSFFSCLQLTHLDLWNCVFRPLSTFQGFSKLTSLVLGQVIISSFMLASLISSSPLLEQLTIESSVTFYYLEIVAPNLKVLRTRALFKSVHCLKTPHLAILSITLKVPTIGEETSNMIKVFDSLPVENLHIDNHYVKSLATDGIPERLPTTLNRLQILKLADICFADLKVVTCVLLLICSSPNLQEVEITLRGYDRPNSEMDLVLEFLMLEGYSDFSLKQLRKVEIQYVSGMNTELEFIKLVLAKSPKLENMVIMPDLRKVSNRGLEITKKVIQFRRASPNAEIMYDDTYADPIAASYYW